MHLKSVIAKLGYSPQEAAVYLASLELGGSTISEIAEKARLPRTTTHLIVKSLQEKGLMNAFLKRKRKIWAAENPERLLISLHENEAALKIVLPELQSLRHDTGVKPTIRAYSGVLEIKQMMSDIIETKHNLSAIIAWDDWVAALGRSFVDDFIENRYRHFLRIRLLTPKTKLSQGLKQKDAQELRITQFLPESIKINNSNFIYGNKVAIISLNKKRPVGILIEDADVHQTMQILFDSLWRESGGSDAE